MACACAATPILAKNGDVLGVYAAFNRQPRPPSAREQGLVDLSIRLAAIAIERKRDEEALRASEERQARIVETIADGILLVDREGRITQANAAAEKLLGLPRAEITRRTYNDPAWKITTADGRPVPDREYAVAQVLLTGHAVYGVERAFWRPGRGRIVVLVNAAPLRDSAGISSASSNPSATSPNAAWRRRPSAAARNVFAPWSKRAPTPSR